MRELILVLLVYATTVVQTSVCPQLVIGGACLDTFAWVLVFAALLGRSRRLFLVGAGLGLVRDLAGTGLLGPFAVAYCVCGFALELARGPLHREGVVVHVAMVGVVSWASHVLAGTAAMIAGDTDIGFATLVWGAAAGALYTALLTPLVFLVLRRLERRLRALGTLRTS